MESKKEHRWQEMIESKDFEQLTITEKKFVLEMSTESNYRLERSILIESVLITDDLDPKPLIFNEKRTGVVVPLYQTVLAVAASFVLAFFLFRSNGEVESGFKIQPLASADTVYVEKLQIDTVLQTKTEYVQIATKDPVPAKNEVISSSERTSAVLSNQSDFSADLRSITLKNKGSSASNDETLFLVEDWTVPE